MTIMEEERLCTQELNSIFKVPKVPEVKIVWRGRGGR